MTQAAIKTALDGKAGSSHGTHLTLGTGSDNAYRGDYGNTAYQHSQAAHAPSNAQKNSDITKAEIEAKLTGAITTHTHSYLPLAGGIMTGDVSYKFTGTGGHAIGLTWINNNTNNTKFGGIGALANAGTGSSLYIGWGSEPWIASNNLQISSSGIKYKNNKIYHAGDKPTPADIGAAASSHGTHVSYGGNGSATTVSRSDHTHSYLPLSGGTMTGKITTPNNAQGITIGDDVTLCDRNIADHLVLEGSTATNGGITFGSGKDTNIYRGGANLLKTDDTMNAVGGFQWNGQSLDSRYAAASHGTHLTIGTGASNAAAGNHTHNYAGSSSAGGAANNSEKFGGYSLWVGTQAQYDAISSKSSTTIYIIK